MATMTRNLQLVKARNFAAETMMRKDVNGRKRLMNKWLRDNGFERLKRVGRPRKFA